MNLFPSWIYSGGRWKRILTLVSLAVCLGSGPGSVMHSTEESQEAAAPSLLSLFPVSAQRGTVFEAEVRGKDLEGGYGVWFGAPGLRGEVTKIDGMQFREKKGLRSKIEWVPGQRVSLRVEVPPEVRLGRHALRLVSPSGVSNSLWMAVIDEPVAFEQSQPHSRPAEAQPLRLPTVLNGKLSRHGEVDFYSFRASEGEQLAIRAISNTSVTKFDGVRLTLYKESSSWFDPGRPIRLAFSPEARITRLCRDSGRYLLEVGSTLGVGGPDFFYQLRVGASDQLDPLEEEVVLTTPSPLADLQRPFRRKLDLARLGWLESRTVLGETIQGNGTSPGNPAGSFSSLKDGSSAASETGPSSAASAANSLAEMEPNDQPEQATEILLPQLLEGAIQSPGDIDWFRFKVEPKARLAFELETSQAAPPQFNPRLAVLDATGEELLTNYFRKIAGNGDDWVRIIQSKTIYTFERGGIYRLQLRDITPRFGEPEFRYRLLVRPQIPHVGRIEMTPEVVNLRPGQAEKVTIVTQQEEGFGGEVVFIADGLPGDVRILPGAEVEPDTEPPLPEIHKERFVPKSQKTTVLLMAGAALAEVRWWVPATSKEAMSPIGWSPSETSSPPFTRPSASIGKRPT